MTSTLGRSNRHVPSDDDHLDPERFRILVATAARVPAVTLAVVATVVVTTMVVANSDLTGIYAAIAGTWLALHQVTLTIDDTSLGVLPLLPTLVLVWRSARGCAVAADAVAEHSGDALDRQDVARITAAALAGPLTVTVVALVVMQDAASVLPVSPPNAGAALAWVTGIYVVAAMLGIGSRIWRPITRYYGVPAWLVLAFRPAVRVLLGMFAMGGVLLVGGLLWSWNEVGDLLERGDHWTGVLGLTVMSILYLPNVIIAAAAVLAGSTVDFGAMRLSLFEATGGDLPALPVLAAIPAGPAASFWPVLLAVPATVGALLGRFAAQRTLQAQADGDDVGSTDAAWTVLSAAGGAGVVAAVLTWVAGGPLGVFGVVGANWWLAGILVFAWTGLLGVITAQLLMWREGRFAAAALRADSGAGDGPEDDSTEDDSTEDDSTEDDSEDTVDADTDDRDGELGEQKALEAPAADTAADASPDPDGTETDGTETGGTETDATESETAESDIDESGTDEPAARAEADIVDAEIVEVDDRPEDATGKSEKAAKRNPETDENSAAENPAAENPAPENAEGENKAEKGAD